MIAAVGTREKLAAWARGAAEIDLDGRALLPAFLDAHGHFSGAAQALLRPRGISKILAPLCEHFNIPAQAHSIFPVFRVLLVLRAKMG